MSEESWSILDSLELTGREREIVGKLLELPQRITVSCSDERCVFYSTIPLSDTPKLHGFSSIKDTPVMVYTGEKTTATALIQPPYIHLIIVIKRMLGDEST